MSEGTFVSIPALHPVAPLLVASIKQNDGRIAQKYYKAFNTDMSTSARIDCLTRIVECGVATDSEEGELLDLINPFTPY